jgi:hypothetical protein
MERKISHVPSASAVQPLAVGSLLQRADIL